MCAEAESCFLPHAVSRWMLLALLWCGCCGEIMAHDVQIQNMVANRVDQALDSAVSALTERNDNRLADISSQL